MNKVHRKVEYALMALKHMSQKRSGKLTTVKEITQTYGCPFDATSRVLQQLVQANILKSEQGALGGYLLIKDLHRVTLFNLIEIVVGPIRIVKCIDNNNSPCDMESQCNIVDPLSLLNRKLIEFYKSISLQSLIEENIKKINQIDTTHSSTEQAL